MTFRGWPKEALDFYVGLEADNSRQYWLAHKAVYDESVKAPFLELSDAIEREFGPLRVFRPNRDIRFSKDKSPVQDRGGGRDRGRGRRRVLRADLERRPLRRIGLLPPDARPARAVPRRGRRRAPGPKLATAVAALRKQRYDVDSRESLQRAPRGYPPDHPRDRAAAQEGDARRARSSARRLGCTARRALDRTQDRGATRADEPLARQARRPEHPRPEPD